MTRTSGDAGFKARAASIGLLLVLAWLASPVWTPVHVEGFSASIQSLAMHLAGDDIRNYDTVHPLNLQFFATSRYGTVLAAALGYLVAPASGEWPMRVLMWLAFAGTLAGGVVLVQRWTGSPRLWALAALALMPGVFESAFFYNDNVLSSALMSASLVLLTRPSGLTVLRAAGAGAVFGLAVLARADALILGVAAAWCLYRGADSWRARCLTALAFAVAVLVPVIGLPGLLHFTLLDTFHIATKAIQLWDRGPSLYAHRVSLLTFVGVPGAAIGCIGIAVLVRRRSWGALLLLVGAPLVYNLVYLGKMWQPRQLLPLAPFLAALIVVGLLAMRDLPARSLRWVAFGLVAAFCLAPPRHAVLQDGPHTVLGRFWTPLLWHSWQASVRADFHRLQALVAGLPNNALLVTDFWDPDRFLHLELQEAGYHLVPPPAGQPTDRCDKNIETFARGGLTVRHLRLHVPFIADWELAVPGEIERSGRACPAVSPSSTYYVGGVDRLLRGRPGFDPTLGQVDGYWARRIGYRSSSSVRLDRWPDPVLLEEAREAARRRLVTAGGTPRLPNEAAIGAAMQPVLKGYWTEGQAAR